MEILALSHRGHAPLPTTAGHFAARHGLGEEDNDGDTHDAGDTSLLGQISHKVKAVNAIRRIYPKQRPGKDESDGAESDVKLVVIGHSVGAYIGLHALEQTRDDIDGLQLLFPTVMHIAKAPKAKTLPLLLATNKLVQRFILPLPLFIISMLPAFVLLSILRFFTGMPASGLQTTLEFALTPGAPLNAARMAREEFDVIKEMTPGISRAVKALRARNGSVRSYWSKGDQDTWAPQGHRRDLESALLLTRVDLPPHLNASPGAISKATRSSLRSRTLAMGGTITRAAGRRLVGSRPGGHKPTPSSASRNDGGLPAPASPGAPPTPKRPGVTPILGSASASTPPFSPSSAMASRSSIRAPRRRPSVSLATAKRSFDGTITLELPQGEDWGFLDGDGDTSATEGDGDAVRNSNGNGDANHSGGAGEDVFGPKSGIPPASSSPPPSAPHHSPPQVRARTLVAKQNTRLGEVTSTVCQQGMPHAFCLKYGQEMGVISAWWIANDCL